MSHGVNATDRVIAGFNLVLAGAWLSTPDTSRGAVLAACAHVTAALVPWLLRARLAAIRSRKHDEPARPSADVSLRHAVRELYPLVAIAIFWIEMDSIIAALGRPRLDGWVSALDNRVFGRHLHVTWPASMSSLTLVQTMDFAYVAYYLLIFLPPLALFVQRRTEALRDSMFRLMTVYLLCYVFYLVWPTVGTRYTDGNEVIAASGVFGRIMEWVHATGDSRGTAFPSSHVAGAVTIALTGWRWFSRPVAVLFTFEATGVVLSTVYTGNHYAIDSLAGLAGTLLLQLVVIPIGVEAARSRERRALVPVLPAFERLRGMEPVSGHRGGGRSRAVPAAGIARIGSARSRLDTHVAAHWRRR